jgi:hypothetical protein
MHKIVENQMNWFHHQERRKENEFAVHFTSMYQMVKEEAGSYERLKDQF